MVWVVVISAMPIVAWGMWLVFCYRIAKMHGIEGLKAVQPVAKAFPVTAWLTSQRHTRHGDMSSTGRPPSQR